MSSLGYKRCWQCGAENADDRQFCGICGEPLSAKELIDTLTNKIKEITTEVDDSDKPVEWNEIERLADKYGITLISAEENKRANGEHRNNMASSGSMIFLNEFDDPDLEIVAFFHELGHVEISRSPYFSFNSAFCYLASEALAWSVGFAIAEREGYVWDYRSKQKEYARECLKTYLNHEGELGGFK